jgi:subtilisin family serine protease
VDNGLGGTSAAAALVTGAVSQVWAANPLLSYQQVVDVLKRSAIDIAQTGVDPFTGAGLLDLGAAMALAKITRTEAEAIGLGGVGESTGASGVNETRERPVNPVPYNIEAHQPIVYWGLTYLVVPEKIPLGIKI